MNEPITIRPEGTEDEGWAYIMLADPNTFARFEGQPSPKEHILFRMPDGDDIVFSLIGQDRERSEAYYVKGHWEYSDNKSSGPVIDA